MADKMWDILRFLKNPENENTKESTTTQTAEIERSQINAQLADALEKMEIAETATDEALRTQAEEDSSVSEPESAFLIQTLEEPAPQTAETPQTIEETTERNDMAAEAETPPEVPVVSEQIPDAAQSSAEAPLPEEHSYEIPISLIKPNPYQPRKMMGENEITELSESIREFGVLQPILVRRVGAEYELIAGERRLRASQRAGLSEIPAVVREADPLNQQIISLVENIQRKNLSAIEEAICLQDILAKTAWSQTELSRRMGRSQASIANKLRLLKLDPAVQELVISGKLGERQARSLLSLSVEEQKLLAQRAIDEDLSARALEAVAENWNAPKGAARRREKPPHTTSEGPGGELLGDLAALISKHRNRGVQAQWKVKQMNQSSLVVEISVDLLESAQASSGGNS